MLILPSRWHEWTPEGLEKESDGARDLGKMVPTSSEVDRRGRRGSEAGGLTGTLAPWRRQGPAVRGREGRPGA